LWLEVVVVGGQRVYFVLLLAVRKEWGRRRRRGRRRRHCVVDIEPSKLSVGRREGAHHLAVGGVVVMVEVEMG